MINSFHSLPVCPSGLVHELREHRYSEHYIRAHSNGQVHQGSKCRMKRDSLHLSNLCCCRGGLVLRVLLGSMGTAAGLASTKLYFVMMVLMNDSCDNEMVHASRFLVTFIPNNQ